MSYPMIGAIFTADADIRLLWGHLTKKGAGSCRFHSLLYPCQCIRTFDSKPSSWITELTFVQVIFQLELHIFTDVLRMTVPFRSNLYFLVPKQNEKKIFQMFWQNNSHIRMSFLNISCGRGLLLEHNFFACEFFLYVPMGISQLRQRKFCQALQG